jgi:hypothetical protein
MFWGIACCRFVGLMMRLQGTWCQCKTLESSRAVRWKGCQRAAIEVRDNQSPHQSQANVRPVPGDRRYTGTLTYIEDASRSVNPFRRIDGMQKGAAARLIAERPLGTGGNHSAD